MRLQILKTPSDNHMMNYKALFLVLSLLLVLTAGTVGVSRIHLGVLNIWIAITIASVKATFVLLFFMHLKYESRVLKYTFLLTIGVLALFIGFIFWDISFR
jgi:cytochrome c oxidase subunit 4